MLTKLKMEIKADKADYIPGQKALLLQSVLMERVDAEYAEKLHLSERHPYSQSVVRDGDKSFWVVNTLNSEAYDKLISPLEKSDFQDFHIKHNDWQVDILSKEKKQISVKSLTKEFYFGEMPHYIKIAFRTPTAFKSGGSYVFYPDVRLLYQSILNKYEAASEDETIYDEDLLEQLSQNTQIVSYQLKSCRYSVGKVAIPSFVGNITVKVKGAQSLVNFAHLLFRFSEYSGVGIKTAMGMGSIEVLKEGENV